MTSSRRTAANQANAQRSTGPRSPEGKAQAARNAFKHGLTIPVALDASAAAEIEALARELAGERSTDPTIWIYAQQMAEAELDLVRIRRAGAQAWNHQLAAPAAHPEAEQRAPLSSTAETAESYRAFCEVLAKINRYERRALSRRRTAFRRLAEV